MSDAASRAHRLAPAAVAATATALLHLGTVRNAALWDDPALVVDNPYLRSASGVVELFRHDLWSASALGERSEFYRPLAMVTYAIDGLLGGYSPFGWHVGNALLHGAVVACLAVALAGALGRGARWLAAACALGFGVAPVVTEAPAWISGRFDVVAALFLLGAVLANARGGLRRGAACVALVACALLCKEAAILAPVLIAADDLIVRGRDPRRVAPKWIALALLAAGYLVLRRVIGVASASAAGVGFVELVRSYAFVIETVLRLAVVPRGLDAFHPYRPPSLATSVAWLAALGAASAALGFAAWRTRAAHARAAAFGALWFLLTLAPTALTGPTLAMTGDRYAYLPGIGLAFVAGGLLVEARQRTRSRALGRAGIAAGALVLAAWAAVAWRRLGDWKDARSLYAASLRADARNPYSLYALGELDVIEGRHETGDARLRQAIALGDRPWRAHTALCFSLLRQSRLDEARAECESSLAIHAGNPRTWVNLASIYVRQTLWAPALASAREALVYRAGYAEAHYLAGVALANLGHMPEAAAELAQTLAIDPGHAGARGVVQLLRSRGVQVP